MVDRDEDGREYGVGWSAEREKKEGVEGRRKGEEALKRVRRVVRARIRGRDRAAQRLAAKTNKNRGPIPRRRGRRMPRRASLFSFFPPVGSLASPAWNYARILNAEYYEILSRNLPPGCPTPRFVRTSSFPPSRPATCISPRIVAFLPPSCSPWTALEILTINAPLRAGPSELLIKTSLLSPYLVLRGNASSCRPNVSPNARHSSRVIATSSRRPPERDSLLASVRGLYRRIVRRRAGCFLIKASTMLASKTQLTSNRFDVSVFAIRRGIDPSFFSCSDFSIVRRFDRG